MSGPMAAQNAAASEHTILTAWRRDYRLSLALLVAGVVLVVAISAFSFWDNSTGNYSMSFWAGLSIDLIGTAGGMLIILGGIFAFHNWSLLRQSRRIT